MEARRPNRPNDSLPADLRRRLDDVRLGLLGVHKALLDYERIRFERERGRVPSSGEFLQLVIHDPWFEWLRPLSELVVRLDETLAPTDSPPPREGFEQIIAEARALLRPDENGGEFQKRYFRAIQDSPEVGMVHSTWKRLAGPAPVPAAAPAESRQEEPAAPSAAPIDPRVRIGHTHLKVADLKRAIDFYCGVLGFQVMQRFGAGAAFISAGGYHHHIGLNTWESLGGPPPAPGTTGLYHHAILYPTRAALADALRRLVAAGIALDGAADHGVSEALYLRDPDGNGVELYWDRPLDDWPRTADGHLAMYTKPLDLDGLLREAQG
jgi:catechol 2,3-dioxygenase